VHICRRFLIWLPRPHSKKAAARLTTDALFARERESP
jgi:hypothetical protein